MSQKVQKLLSQLQAGLEDVLQLFRSVDVKQEMLAMDEDKRSEIWKLILENVRVALSKLLEPDSSAQDGIPNPSPNDCIYILKAICTLVQNFFPKGNGAPNPHMFNVCSTLHDALLDLGSVNAASLQFQIARICEQFWVNNWPKRVHLVSHSVIYLLGVSVVEGSKEADVKRVFHLREALAVFDFDDESIDHVRELLKKAMFSPLFLKCQEGQRFLSYVLLLHLPTTEMIHEVVRMHVPGLPLRICGLYGDIYARAWKDAPSEFAELLEERLQDWVFAAIHASHPSTFKTIRSLMVSIQTQRDHLEKGLLRVYGPILWRALKCSNALVRLQAVTFFFDAFPLLDRSANVSEGERLRQMQFDVMTGLLRDDDYRVRAACTTGVCHALRVFWETIPVETQKPLLAYICGTLAWDVSHPHIRIAVLSGISELLDNSLAHSVLKHVLPTLANLLHDKKVAVRVAFIKLLQKTQQVQGWRYTDIVPVESLLEQLSLDASNNRVALNITSLLLQSFYPKTRSNTNSDEGRPGVGGIEQLKRCLALVDKHPDAAIVFYKYLHKNTSVGSSVKMCVVLLRSLTVTSENREIQSNDKPNNRDLLSESLIRSRLLGIMFVLVESVQQSIRLQKHAPSLEMLKAEFTSETCSALYAAVFPDPITSVKPHAAAMVNILKLFGVLSEILNLNVDEMSARVDEIFQALASQYEGSGLSSTLHPQVGALISYLCGTEQEGLLVDFSFFAFQCVLHTESSKAQDNIRSTKRRKTTSVKSYGLSHVALCIDLIAWFFHDKSVEVNSARERLFKNEERCMQLQNVLKIGQSACETTFQEVEYQCESSELEYLCAVIQLLWESSLHSLHLKNGDDSEREVLGLMDWTTRVVGPQITGLCSCDVHREAVATTDNKQENQTQIKCRHEFAIRLLTVAMVMTSEAVQKIEFAGSFDKWRLDIDSWAKLLLNIEECEPSRNMDVTGLAACRLAVQIHASKNAVPGKLLHMLLAMSSRLRTKRTNNSSDEDENDATNDCKTLFVPTLVATKALKMILSDKGQVDHNVQICCHFIQANLIINEDITADCPLSASKSLTDLRWVNSSAVAVCECLCEFSFAFKAALDVICSWSRPKNLALIGGLYRCAHASKNLQDYAIQKYEQCLKQVSSVDGGSLIQETPKTGENSRKPLARINPLADNMAAPSLKIQKTVPDDNPLDSTQPTLVI